MLGTNACAPPPNNSFKPNLLRYSNGVAEKACHAVAFTTQVGLTQALDLMNLLGSGRSAFLEFLRNLTPQVLLLALTLVTFSKLDLQRFDPSNWFDTVVFFSCFATWFLAVVANMLQFVENYSATALSPVDFRMVKARRRLPTVKQRRDFLWRCIKRYKWQVGSHVFVVMLVVQIGFLVAASVGIQHGLQIIRASQSP